MEKVIHAHEFADERADGLGLGREFQPVVERADLVGFKVAPGDVPECGGINQRGDRFPQGREHPLEPRVKQQRLLVAHEEVVELHVELRDVNGEPEQVGGDFVDGGHGITRLAPLDAFENFFGAAWCDLVQPRPERCYPTSNVRFALRRYLTIFPSLTVAERFCTLRDLMFFTVCDASFTALRAASSQPLSDWAIISITLWMAMRPMEPGLCPAVKFRES